MANSQRKHSHSEESKNRKWSRTFHELEGKQIILFHSTGASLSQTFNKNFWRAISKVLEITCAHRVVSLASSRSTHGWCCKQTMVENSRHWDSKTGTPSIVCLPVHVLKIFWTVDVIWIVKLLSFVVFFLTFYLVPRLNMLFNLHAFNELIAVLCAISFGLCHMCHMT